MMDFVCGLRVELLGSLVVLWCCALADQLVSKRTTAEEPVREKKQARVP
jgi:hypothetical protein